MTANEARAKQAHYLEEFEKGNISQMERDTMLQLFYEIIEANEKLGEKDDDKM